MKTWIQSNEIKDKKALLVAHKLIEREMEQFEFILWKQNKGILNRRPSQQPKTDPKEKTKEETRDRKLS